MPSASNILITIDPQTNVSKMQHVLSSDNQTLEAANDKRATHDSETTSGNTATNDNETTSQSGNGGTDDNWLCVSIYNEAADDT